MDSDLIGIVIPSVWCLFILSSIIYCMVSKTSLLNRKLKSKDENFRYVKDEMIENDE